MAFANGAGLMVKNAIRRAQGPRPSLKRSPRPPYQASTATRWRAGAADDQRADVAETAEAAHIRREAELAYDDVLVGAMADAETKSIFEPDESEDASLDAQALAAYRDGRVVPHAKVALWLDSWGTPDELPCPEPERR